MMQIDMNRDTQIKDRCESLQAALYKKIFDHSSKGVSTWIRLTAPLAGVASALLTIAARIGLIAENILKGLGNIFWGLLCLKNSLGLGISQLIGGTLTNAIALPLSGLAASRNFVGVSVYLLGGDLHDYSYQRWCDYDPVEKEAGQARYQANQEAARQAELKGQQERQLSELRAQQARAQDAEQARIHQEQMKFNALIIAVNQPSPNPQALYDLSKCYELGRGVEQSGERHLHCLQQAADQNHPEALYDLAKTYQTNNDFSRAIQLYTQAKGAGYTQAIEKIFECELEINEIDGNMHPNEVFHHYYALAYSGNLGAKWMVGYLYSVGKGTQRNPKEALEWFRKLADHVPNPASEIEKEMVEQGKGSAYTFHIIHSLPGRDCELGWHSVPTINFGSTIGLLFTEDKFRLENPHSDSDLGAGAIRDRLTAFSNVKKFFKP
ncbi:MAG: tetratricopeptide repeat protein [Chlamydiales bacterium]